VRAALYLVRRLGSALFLDRVGFLRVIIAAGDHRCQLGEKTGCFGSPEGSELVWALENRRIASSKFSKTPVVTTEASLLLPMGHHMDFNHLTC
jgi:hypothetical protein